MPQRFSLHLGDEERHSKLSSSMRAKRPACAAHTRLSRLLAGAKAAHFAVFHGFLESALFMGFCSCATELAMCPHVFIARFEALV